MTLWWIGNVVLLLVVVPVVVYLLTACCGPRTASFPRSSEIANVAAAGSKDLDAAPLLVTTATRSSARSSGLAEYGGSLDVIVDDAEEER